MSHVMCAGCRTRMRAEPGADLGRCPACGGPWEPVGELLEIVGFHLVSPYERLAGDLRRALALPPGPPT